MNQSLGISGIVRLWQYRNDQLIRESTFKNKILWWGKSSLLNQFFRASSAFSAFYIGLLKTGITFTQNKPAISTIIADEFTTYAPSARPAITFEAANEADDANYIYVNNAPANYCVFTIGAAVTNQALNGIFIAPNSSGTPTTLWCTAAFGNNDATPAPVTVSTGDILRIQYTARIPKS